MGFLAPIKKTNVRFVISAKFYARKTICDFLKRKNAFPDNPPQVTLDGVKSSGVSIWKWPKSRFADTGPV